jgi:hypothetical protein
MRPLDESFDEEQVLPIDGLVVEESSDEVTVRQFMLAWRRRVSREYAMALLQERSDKAPLRRAH